MILWFWFLNTYLLEIHSEIFMDIIIWCSNLLIVICEREVGRCLSVKSDWPWVYNCQLGDGYMGVTLFFSSFVHVRNFYHELKKNKVDQTWQCFKKIMQIFLEDIYLLQRLQKFPIGIIQQIWAHSWNVHDKMRFQDQEPAEKAVVNINILKMFKDIK